MNFKLRLRDYYFSVSIDRIKKSIFRFVDLAPVDNADPDGSYSKALTFAMSNDRIKNFAITGPYGSGKSSIIRTFEKRNAFKFLHISLASFKESDGDSGKDDVKNTLIEQSILQQMLYGADANRLPYSRFKRISTPDNSLIKAFVLVFWAVSVVYLFSYSNQLLDSGVYTREYFWLIFLLSFSLSIPVVLLSDIYKISFGISFKKISLRNAEIETGDVLENSILNRYLDEIIYFFQSTSYDIVVIEDLDRFGTPEIFVKLREINKLVNGNEKTSGNIKFLYALKDDMFANKNRAKFFDFIIPIVPIINSSNSMDKMQERIVGEDIEDKIESQFVREVSWYVDDLRLIHNIFNEFIIYNERLKSDHLNATKLLAMMIYKNVYPGDFELLHNGKGALYSVSQKMNELMSITKQNISDQILQIQDEIKKSDREAARNSEELIKCFIGHIAAITPQPSSTMYVNGETLSFSQLLNWETFEKVLGISNVELVNIRGGRFPLGVTVSQILSEISPNEPILKRKSYIENRAHKKRVELEERRRQLEKERKTVTQLPLNQLLQENMAVIGSVIEENDLENSSLFIYLIANGYIDETYHFYTSNFHEGRLTKNDRNFLLSIRDFRCPDPNRVLDTPEEVCNNMREQDFGYKYVLNVTLIDYLLTDDGIGARRISAAIDYVAANFKDSEEFFASYWEMGKNVPEFTRALSEHWPEYASTSLKSANASSHIALILSHNDSKTIIEKMNAGNVLTDYLSEYGYMVFMSDLYSHSDLQVLLNLNTKFTNLSSLEDLDKYLDFACDNNMYMINKDNILFLMKRYAGDEDVDRYLYSNYSILSAPGCEKIKEYVDGNISEYIEKVFSTLSENTKENGDAIKSLLNNPSLDNDIKYSIISEQEFVFSDFNRIPKEFWSHLVKENKIVPSWRSVSDLFFLDDANTELVAAKIQSAEWIERLTAESMSNVLEDGDRRKSLSRFIYENDDLSDDAYSLLVEDLPYWYHDFPEVTIDKMMSLARSERVRLTKSSFLTALEIDEDLCALLIEKGAATYFASKDEYPINDDIRGLLLRSDLSADRKTEICHDVTLSGVISNRVLAKDLAEYLASDDISCTKIDSEVMIALIKGAQSTENSIRLLNKIIPRLNEGDFMAVITTLPSPYSEIAAYGKRPKFAKTAVNSKLAELLKSRGFISTFTDHNGSIKINTFHNADHSEGSVS
tara:strand:- start:235811 stop:239416 length:3606 start_codon:yes stop_codon:yes gene_type:complete